MKTEYPIIKISDTQSVLVDKTRIPKDNKPYWDDKLKEQKIRGLTPDWYRIGEDLPWVTRTFANQREATEKVSDMADMIGREVRLSFPNDEKDTPFTLSGTYL